MSSSKARRAEVIPHTKEWRVAASSSSSESTSSLEVAAHEMHASSNVRASPPAALEKGMPRLLGHVDLRGGGPGHRLGDG
jgi:hypothetical protein